MHLIAVTGRLAQATAKLCDMEAQIKDLVQANLRLRHDLSEATLALFVLAPHRIDGYPPCSSA